MRAFRISGSDVTCWLTMPVLGAGFEKSGLARVFGVLVNAMEN